MISGEFWILDKSNQHKLNCWNDHFEKQINEHGKVAVRVEPYSPRSHKQNDLSFAVYVIIAKQCFDGDTEQARAVCKLEVGIPILRRDDEGYRNTYDKSLKNLDYETKIDLIKTMDIPVTRLMSRKQMMEYQERVFQKFAAQGCIFE